MAELKVVDGLALPDEVRAVLRPGERLEGRDGKARRLPRWFYEVPSWEAALETDLAPHFKAWEFLNVDVREHEAQRLRWPRYLPTAVSLLAAVLEVLRHEADTYVHVAANGGYRSPAHKLTRYASTHCWGTAVNLYRIGDDWLDDDKTITRYARLAREVSPAIVARPYGHGVGESDDHLHLDLGYVTVVPAGASEDDEAGARDAGGDGEGNTDQAHADV
jgi:hypothetical protein